MSTNQSVVYLCADADKAKANLGMAAFYGNASDAQNLSVGLVPLDVANDGSVPATHWGGASWQPPAQATALKDWPGGVNPTPASDWSNYGMDEDDALAAGAAMTVQVMTSAGGDEDTLPMSNFAALLAAKGLQEIVYQL